MVRKKQGGFTFIEMSLVVGLILTLLFIGGMISWRVVRDWRLGKDASLGLQAVYAAQRAYLADHPTLSIADVTEAILIEHLPMGSTTMPTMEGLEGETLTLNFSSMPPEFQEGGIRYDPSSKSNDALWDVGE
jgi:type II secretory pathway pseudopilin PulG